MKALQNKLKVLQEANINLTQQNKEL